MTDDRKYPEEEFVTILRNAKLTIDGTEVTVTAYSCKFIVFTRIRAGPTADFTQSDLALLYIPSFSTMPAISVSSVNDGYHTAALSVNSIVQPQLDLATSSFHYGWVNNFRPSTVLESENETISSIGDVTFTRTNATTTGGSSGSPVFTVDYQHLVGVHFASGGNAVRIDRLIAFMQDNVELQGHLEQAKRFEALPNNMGSARALEEVQSAKKLLQSRNYGVHQL